VSKLAFVADVHLGNPKRHGGQMRAGLNDRCRRTLAVLRDAVDCALDKGATGFVVLGDLFDTAQPSPQLIAATQDIFEDAKRRDCEVVVLMGNHDQAGPAQGDHALGPLGPVATIVDRPQVLSRAAWPCDLWAVPFRPGVAATWLPEAVRELRVRTTQAVKRRVPPVMGIHLGVRDANTAIWLSQSADAIDVSKLSDLCASFELRAAFAGNWHNHHRWSFVWPDEESEADIVQVGALVPTGWNNPGLRGYGGVALWDGKQVEMTTLPGPRFLRVGLSELDEIDPSTDLCLQVVVGPDEMADAAARIDALRAASHIGPSEVVVDDAVTNAQARSAADAARSSETFSESVAGYLASMPLDEGCDRASVTARVLAYLKGAA
jgi:hypothetical protein